MRNETVRALQEKWAERRRKRRISRIQNIVCAVGAIICAACLIHIDYTAMVEAREEPVPEEKASVVYYAEPVDEPVEPVVYEPVVVEAEPVAEEVEPESLGEFKITHYCPCEKCCGEWANGITATGTTAVEGRTIAVDPKVIPYGTEVTIRYQDGREHTYISEDCGGAIKGNRLDVFMDSHEAALVAGVKYGEVFINGR